MGKFTCALASAGAVALLVAAGAEASISYGDFLGAGSNPDILDVSEDSPDTGLPLFGSPIRVGNQLLFFPTQYASSASGGASDTSTGILSMIIQAKPGNVLDKITIQEFGDWTLSGVGSAATSVSASGTLTATNLLGPGVYSDVMGVNPGSPISLPGPSSGTWDGLVYLDLTGLGLTRIELVFENVLEATSEPGTTSFIRKNVISGPSVAVIIPSPSAFGLLGMAGMALAGRRRR